MSFTLFATALIAATPLPAAPVAGLALAAESDLAATTLATGRGEEAIVTLQRASAADPHDPAVMINLGIAYAHRGEDAKARAAFEAALTCHEVVDLDTADGATTDSRRLARRAIRMLERGEFRPAQLRTEQLTYRN